MRKISSLLVLRAAPAGTPLASMRVVCNDEPCQAISSYDPDTQRTTIRFASRNPGVVEFVLHNLGSHPTAFFHIFKDAMGPGEKWTQRPLEPVNDLNVLDLGQGTSVTRDKNTEREIILERSSNEKAPVGQSVGVIPDQDKPGTGQLRIKWLLQVSPMSETPHDSVPNMSTARWDIFNHTQGDLRVFVLLPNGKKVEIATTVDATVGDIQEQLESRTGIPQSEQVLSYLGVDMKRTATLSSHDVAFFGTIKLSRRENIRVIVRGDDMSDVEFITRPNTLVKDFKELLECETRIPNVQQRLFYSRRLLADGKHLSDYGIEDGSVLRLCQDLRKVVVHIIPLDRKEFSLVADVYSTVKSIKEQVSKRESTPVDQIRLVHTWGSWMEDKRTLISYNIKCYTLLHLVRDEDPITLDIEFSRHNRRFLVTAQAASPLRCLKVVINCHAGVHPNVQHLFHFDTLMENHSKVCDHISSCSRQLELYLELEDITINIRFVDGRIITLDLKITCTVMEVKKRVELMEDIPWTRMRLMRGPTPLENFRRLCHCAVKHNTVLNLVCDDDDVTLIVTIPEKRTFEITLKQDSTIAEAKKAICVQEGVPQYRQILSHASRAIKDDLKLMEINEDGGGTIVLSMEIGPDLVRQDFHAAHPADEFYLHVDSPWPSRTVSIRCKPSDPLTVIKSDVRRKLKINPSSQRLTLGHHILKDDVAIEHYGFSCCAAVRVLSTKSSKGWDDIRQLFVRTITGKMMKIPYEASLRVKDVKVQIEEAKNIPCDQQRLVFRGMTLSADEETLEHYDVGPRDILMLLVRCRGEEGLSAKRARRDEDGNLADEVPIIPCKISIKSMRRFGEGNLVPAKIVNGDYVPEPESCVSDKILYRDMMKGIQFELYLVE